MLQCNIVLIGADAMGIPEMLRCSNCRAHEPCSLVIPEGFVRVRTFGYRLRLAGNLMSAILRP